MNALHPDTFIPKLPADASGFVLGVSGGLDSMVLLHLMKNCGKPCVVAHVNYGIRGLDSDADENLVREVCTREELPFFSVRPNARELKKGNFQNNAREYRYAFFKELMTTHGVNWMVTAHHRDDQVETQFMKLMRGDSFLTSPGITALDEHSRVWRPLLHFTRKQLEAYARNHGISWREDASNSDSDYVRNRLRNQVFPILNDIHPGWQHHLQEAAARHHENGELVHAILPLLTSGDRNRLDLSTLKGFSAQNRMRILHAFLTSHEAVVSGNLLKELHDLVDKQPGKWVRINQYSRLWRNQTELRIENEPSPTNVDSCDQLVADFPSNLVAGNIHLAVKRRQEVDLKVVKGGGDLWLDSAQLHVPLRVRRWIASDRIIPLGMHGSVLVSDLLNSRGIVSSRKSETFVMLTFDGIICAVIFPHPSGRGDAGCIHNHFRVSEGSKEVIQISISYTE